MKINSIDAVYFGVEDVATSVKYFNDFGLIEVSHENNRGELETLDGSKVYVWPLDDPELPENWSTGSSLRMVRWRVASQACLDEIADELGKDRSVEIKNGTLYTHDDSGLGLAFVIGDKPEPPAPGPAGNVPGIFQRAVNTRGRPDNVVKMRSVAHVVLNCAEHQKNIDFYTQRLNFIISDSFKGMGAFIRAKGAVEHHSMFIVNRPPNSLNHVAFYVTDLQEVILTGKQMYEAGWSSRWGPGRHILGSNFFWYFDSPLGGGIESTCDPDHVDENWVASELELKPENTAAWTLTDFLKEKQ